MVKPSFLNAQRDRSLRQRRTTPFLRRLCLGVADKALRIHYGDNYSDKCLQATLAVFAVLQRVGLKAEVIIGEVCTVETRDIGDGRYAAKWSGFWGEHHHHWCLTEFGEIADLSISQLSLHAKCSEDGWRSPPPVWWQVAPHGFFGGLLYGQQGVGGGVLLPDAEQADLESLMQLVGSTIEGVIDGEDDPPLMQEFLVEDVASLEGSARTLGSWANQAAQFIQHNEAPLKV